MIEKKKKSKGKQVPKEREDASTKRAREERMQEIRELTKHEEILTRKGKNIAQEVISQALHKNVSKEPPISRIEEHEEALDHQTSPEPQSPPHVSPSTYLQTPHNSPLNTPEKIQETTVLTEAHEGVPSGILAMETAQAATQEKETPLQTEP